MVRSYPTSMLPRCGVRLESSRPMAQYSAGHSLTTYVTSAPKRQTLRFALQLWPLASARLSNDCPKVCNPRWARAEWDSQLENDKGSRLRACLPRIRGSWGG